MALRATLSMQSDVVFNAIRDNYSELFRIQSQMSSGKRIQTVSDDPIVTHQALNLRKSLSRNRGILNGIDNAMPGVLLTQNTLQQLTDTVQSVKTVALGAINAAQSDPDSLAALGAQVDSAINNMIVLANSKIGNKYIFAGQKSTTQPFTHDTGSNRVYFNGNDNKFQIPVDTGGVMQDISVSGGEMFHTHKLRGTVGLSSKTTALNTLLDPDATSGAFTVQVGTDSAIQVLGIDPATSTLEDVADAINAISGLRATAYIEELNGSFYLQINSNVLGSDGQLRLTDGLANGLLTRLGMADSSGTHTATVIDQPVDGALDTMIKISQMLQGGAVNSQVMSGYIERLDAGMDRLIEQHSIVGTYEIRMEQVKTLKESLQIDFTRLLSDIEDVDISEASIEFSKRQTLYNIALQLAVRIHQSSIVSAL